MSKSSILVFGLGFLQKSLIEQCKSLGLYTVGVDITAEAECKDDVDAFEIAAGDDFDANLAIAQKYHVSGIVTAATDKPLVMMARVAEALALPFYSVKTAMWSTDKLQMKERFQQFGIPCARGKVIKDISELKKNQWEYPVIVKPRDNSGSRGVVYCESAEDVADAVSNAFSYTKKDSVLVEEYVEGLEYSVESLHYNGKTYVIQFTKKITTDFPYNVELGHIQPADLTKEQKKEIEDLIERISNSLGFENCASHTELKINSNRITVIETSPRLGGDFITSKLTPLSTGINIENILVRMSIGEPIKEEDFIPKLNESSGVVFFELQEGKVISIGNLLYLNDIDGCIGFSFDKKIGNAIEKITSSIDRYGYALFKTHNYKRTEFSIRMANEIINDIIKVEPF